MTAPVETKTSRARLLLTPIGFMALALAAMWGIEVADSVVLDEALQRNGLRPRHRDGLDGIAWAPFLHSDYGHVASNSVPLLVLGGLVAARGRRYWGWVTCAAILLGGGLTWLLAGDGIHIGASGVVFGYFGAILGAAIFERRIRALGAALIALGFYSSLIAGLVPQEAISWEGHLFGLVGGVIASRALAEPRVTSKDTPYEPEPWELDEPWNLA
ncbi:MAG: rhomboid family intramembrane serine protease [Acidimicrobiales bacterium]|nr:rhomboid family intramembrane serine protease [Acidimicrobiales bacterium]MDG1877113.1 rhomboid family intramembrane serine protease [Acidimicrobiales bacterium]